MKEMPTEKLDGKVVSAWRLSAALVLILVTIICVGGLLVAYTSAVAPSAVRVLGTILVVAIIVILIFAALFLGLIPHLRYTYWSYAVSTDELDIARGIIWRRREVVPLIRVQNVDTVQGPILRHYGLSSVTVSTASGEHNIPGLRNERAAELREHLAYLARMAREDV